VEVLDFRDPYWLFVTFVSFVVKKYMQPFIRHTGKTVALVRANVDTDQIIPKQFLKSIERSGFGPFLFYDWRYLPDGSPNPAFELNRPEARGASVLLTGANFGCGSSREHAPWALADFGFRAIIAPSFADIFFGNCCQNGLLPVALPEPEVDELFRRCHAVSDYEVTLDLDSQSVRDRSGFEARFEIDPYRRDMLLRGLDEIGRTLLDEPRIAAFERRRAALHPAKDAS
jgi:3-isopropylmalate/(R)-2-methylmalate dehydratase small subunit